MTTIVMNTANGAVTDYDWALQSITPTHAGAAAGLFALGGDTDAGAAIAARWKLPLTQMGTNVRKALDTCFLAIRSSGRGKLIVQGEANTWEYPFDVRANGVSRADPGAGIRENFLAVGYANVAGVTFRIDSVEIPVIASKARRS